MIVVVNALLKFVVMEGWIFGNNVMMETIKLGILVLIFACIKFVVII